MKFLRLLFVCTLVFALSSCNLKGIDTNIIENKTETEYSTISTQLLEISYTDDSDFANTLNTQFSQSLIERVAAFEEEAQKAFPIIPSGSKSSYTTTQSIKYNNNNFLSIVEEESIFKGGAHGMTVWNAHNIDFKNKRYVYLNDLFEAEGYEDRLNRMIDEVIANHPEKYTELWMKPQIKEEHQYNFYITDTDLVIYFQPYELSYYARGFVEFPLRLSELGGYLKEDYYFLSGNNKVENGEDDGTSSPFLVK